jgi:hypothetical protein
MIEPVLTPQDRDSASWKKVLAHLNIRLSALRALNDKDHAEAKTAEIRGRIKECKALMALDADDLPVQDENSLFHD